MIAPGALRRELGREWRSLLAATIGSGTGIAAYTSISSLFFRALEHEFGWSKGVSAGALVALPLTALMLPFAGALIDRWGVARSAGASTAMLVLSFLWLANLHGAPLEFYLAVIALNVLGCATGPVSYTRLLVQRFHAARGTALAIALAGIALAGALLPPASGWLIGAYGWRAGYMALAGLGLAGAAAALLLMPRQPAPTAAPGVAAERESQGDASTGSGMRLGQALRTPSFWLLSCAVLAISAASMGLVSQSQSVLLERHIGAWQATLMMSVLAVSVMLSRLAVGRLLDSSKPQRWAAGAMLVAACGAALLWSEQAPSAPVAVLALALIGVCMGAEIDLMSYFCARLFGLRHYGAIYGILFMFFYAGMAAGGIGYGVLHDRTGNYDAALLASAMLLVLAAVLLSFIGNKSGR